MISINHWPGAAALCVKQQHEGRDVFNIFSSGPRGRCIYRQLFSDRFGDAGWYRQRRAGFAAILCVPRVLGRPRMAPCAFALRTCALARPKVYSARKVETPAPIGTPQPMVKVPLNNAMHTNSAITLRFRAANQWRGVGDCER